jgi:hypothetical protein
VTVTDELGQRHTIEVQALSVNRAACHFFARSRSSPAERLPRVGDGTIYEVQVIGESMVYHVEHRRMLEWANRVAEHQWARIRGGLLRPGSYGSVQDATLPSPPKVTSPTDGYP